MSDRQIDITRRKVLGAVGTVGVASAGAGLGTSALFSDIESFDGNTLAAGELDLLIDWQQTYDGPPVPEGGNPTEFGYGAAGAPFVNAHPDHDDDGEQSLLVDDEPVTYSGGATNAEVGQGAGSNIADVLNCQTLTDDYDFDGGQGQEHLVELADVKPGDTGEITFSLHLCDNPGYIWMQAGEVSESENGLEEPEEQDGDTVGDGNGELAENIDVELWYDDDCDNTVSPGDTADFMLTLDFSGSMLYDQYGGVVSESSLDVPQSDGSTTTYSRTTKIDLVELATKRFVDFLNSQGADVQIGLAYFDGSTQDEARVGVFQDLTGDLDAVYASLDDLRQKLANVVSGNPPSPPGNNDGNPDPSAGGGIATGTYIGEGVREAQDELDSSGRGGVDYVNLVLSDGASFTGGDGNPFESPQDAADDARAASPSPATDLYTISVGPGADDATMSAMAGPAGGSGGDPSFFFNVDDPADIPMVFGSITDLFAPEEVFFEGTLDEALTALQSGNGIPLDANGLTAFDEREDDDDDADRECFHPAVTYCLGFRWSVDPEVGNVIQGDSVGFDLGFYTQQCRNNDGSMQT